MAVRLTIPFETLVELVEQLPPEEREALVERVSGRHKPRRLTDTLLTFEVGKWPERLSLRREDEYGDDGR